MTEGQLALSGCFAVRFDDRSLGSFNSVDGLGFELVIKAHEEGGNNKFSWQLPTRLKYTNVKLTRPLSKDTVKVAEWFEGMKGVVKPTDGVIDACDPEGNVMFSWFLRDVIPVRWTGPSFSPDNTKVATETIEIAHHGFSVHEAPARNGAT